MKTFYSDYVRHCMRFHVKHPHPEFHSDVDKQNWLACESVLKKFSDEDAEILKAIYAQGDTLADAIYNVSFHQGLTQDHVWKLVNSLERKIAKRRGLI